MRSTVTLQLAVALPQCGPQRQAIAEVEKGRIKPGNLAAKELYLRDAGVFPHGFFPLSSRCGPHTLLVEGVSLVCDRDGLFARICEATDED
jgi:hypothetical protein